MSNRTVSSSSSSGGIGFFGLLGIVFIVMKLTGFVDWPWIWVLAPLWMPLAIVLGGVILFAVVSLVIYLNDKRREREWRERKGK